MYINDVAPTFTHVDIQSGSTFFAGCGTFSVNWGLDMYVTNGVVCDFRLYPKTNSQYTINLSSAASSTEITFSSGRTCNISGRTISMDEYQSVGKIFLLQAYSYAFKVNGSSTDKLYLYCKLYGGGGAFSPKYILQFFPLDSNPSNAMYLGSVANCNLIQLS